MRKFTVTKNDCYCSISTFYDNIAKKMGMDSNKVTRYDPKKIRVSEDVTEELLMFMRDEGMNEEGAVMYYVSYGPSQTQGHLRVEVDAGFAAVDPKVVAKSVKKGRKLVSFKDIKAARNPKQEDFGTVLGVFPVKAKGRK